MNHLRYNVLDVALTILLCAFLMSFVGCKTPNAGGGTNNGAPTTNTSDSPEPINATEDLPEYYGMTLHEDGIEYVCGSEINYVRLASSSDPNYSIDTGYVLNRLEQEQGPIDFTTSANWGPTWCGGCARSAWFYDGTFTVILSDNNGEYEADCYFKLNGNYELVEQYIIP